ncbi:MAG TPA: RDD family protein [Acidimicrobiales bacterium]|nr:RDD family protein [Acidimicrobiales bacterium]
MADFDPGVSGAGSVQSGPRASFWLRLAAALIDGVLLGAVGTIIRVIVGDALGSALNLLLGLAYYAYLEGSPSGQTVGKRAMSIRVIDFAGGGPIGPGRALIRYLGRIVSAIPCGLGYWWMLWDPEKQTWHDKFATTVVVPTSAYPVAAWPG